MSLEENKRLVRRYIEEVISTGNVEDIGEFVSPDYESLLIADVFVAGRESPIGRFWNLNPQTPEPSTLSLLALGGLAMIRRRRSR